MRRCEAQTIHVLQLLLGGDPASPQKQQAEILLAICDYALNETEPSSSLSPAASVAFNLIRPTLDSGRNKAANRQNKSESNG